MENEVSVFSLDFPPNINAVYEICPVYAQKKALDCYGFGKSDGTNIAIFDRSGRKNQQFKFNLDKDLNVSIEPLHAPGKVLDVKDGIAKDRQNLQLWSKNNTKAQSFKMVRTSDGCYRFISCINSKYAIDVYGKASNNNANVIIYTKNNTDAQKFVLFPKYQLPSTLSYALKYAEQNNPNFNVLVPNSANFCSQCLWAGGLNQDDLWNINSYAFTDETLLREYFISKNVPWKENVPLREVDSGDIIYNKSELGGFCTPLIVVQKLKKGLIYCGNTQGENKGILTMSIIPGVLKTSTLFK